MKRNRESKYKQKLINCLHKNKSQQKDLDKIVQKYGVTYYDMYQFAVKHDYSKFRDMICKMVECEMEDTFKSFGDVSNLPLDVFESMNYLGKNKRPYYLGIDFSSGNDWTGKIMLKKGGNKNRFNTSNTKSGEVLPRTEQIQMWNICYFSNQKRNSR